MARGLGSDTDGGADTEVGGTTDAGKADGNTATSEVTAPEVSKTNDPAVEPGWTGNRSERDARDGGNLAAGNQNGGPAGDNSFTQGIESKVDALQSANPNATIDRAAMISALQTRDPVSKDGEVSEKGWTYGEVESLSRQGFGDLIGINANNFTGQTVDHVLASKNMDDNVMPAVTGLITSTIPGAGLALAGARAAGSVANGKSIGDAAKDFAINYAGSKVAGAINGKIAGVVGPENMAAAGLIGSASKAFGGPGLPNVGAAVVNGALNVAGVSKSGITSVNNSQADNGFMAPGSSYGDAPETAAPVTPTTPTANSVLSDSVKGLDIGLWGGSGWTAAKDKYFSSKGN